MYLVMFMSILSIRWHKDDINEGNENVCPVPNMKNAIRTTKISKE